MNIQNHSLLSGLNFEQLSAVTLPAQSALVLAGAGSGKTRVLTTRIAWLIETAQCAPAEILAVTFTNKAARELMTRISSLLALNPRGMWVGTFHGLCNRFLRTHHQDAALPATFQIIDSQDQLGFIKRLLKSSGVDEENYPPRQLANFINGAKEQGLRAQQVPTCGEFERQMANLYQQYDTQCQKEGVLDFAELLLRSFELLSRNAVLRTHYQARFRHILVDEFQDTNALQYRLIKLLAGYGTAAPAAVFAVGDDDQSIYSFRGADVSNMRSFEHEFHVKKLIRLEQNYRSQGHILDCANTLIAHNSERLGKELRTDAGHGEPVRIYEAQSDSAEAQFVLESVREHLGTGQALCDMAVLYRSNAQSRIVEHALFSAGIAYQVYGGLRYFQRAEIKHALAYLQLLDNPENDTAFLRVVNFPARGIGAKAQEAVLDCARSLGGSLYAAAPSSGRCAIFSQLIDSMRIQCAQLSLRLCITQMLELSGLRQHYALEKDGADRLENLEQLADAAVQFCIEEGFDVDAPAFIGPENSETSLKNLPIITVINANEPLSLSMAPLSAFLAHASLEAGDHQAHAGQDALQLMTVHASKGLEFETVYLTGLEEGLFPHENSRHDPVGMEEERRLMYVAITRAKKYLYLTLSQSRMLHGQFRLNARSRFLAELPEASLKWISSQNRSSTSSKVSWGEPEPIVAFPIVRRNLGWRSGEVVRHTKFGEGIILALEGSAGNVRAQINFRNHGVKLLDLSVAKLEKLFG